MPLVPTILNVLLALLLLLLDSEIQRKPLRTIHEDPAYISSRQDWPRSRTSLILRIVSAVHDDHQQDLIEKDKHLQIYPHSAGLLMPDSLSRHGTRQEDDLPFEGVETEQSSIHMDAQFDDESGPPDGGYAWVMAVCAMASNFSTWGTNAAFGVFLNYYLTSDTFPGATEYDFALIGGLMVLLGQGLAPLLVLLYEMIGFKRLSFAAIVFQTAGYILASFATKMWQLFLTQAVLVGVSFSLLFMPTTLILPTWFDKRLATAMGINVAGTGIGGVVFCLAINAMISRTGDQRWALRMCGIVNFVVAGTAVTILRPYKKQSRKLSETCNWTFILGHLKKIFALRIFRNPILLVLACWFNFCLTGYVLVLFSISSVGVLLGMTHTQGTYLTVALNAAQAVGRPVMGHFADQLGRTNIAAGCSITIAILLLALWINASTYASLMAFSVLIGCIIGVGSSLCQLIASVLLDASPEALNSVWSWFNLFVSFFQFVLEPIALALRVQGTSRPFLHTQIFAGVAFFAAFLLIMVVREYIVRRNFRRRLEYALARVEDAKDGAVDVVIGEYDVNLDHHRITRYRRLLRGQYCLVRAFYPSAV